MVSPVMEGSTLNGRWTKVRPDKSKRNGEALVRRSVTTRVMPDRSKITVTEIEVKYWIKHFGVSREELERAVERVGNSAASVRKQLRNFASDPQ